MAITNGAINAAMKDCIDSMESIPEVDLIKFKGGSTDLKAELKFTLDQFEKVPIQTEGSPTEVFKSLLNSTNKPLPRLTYTAHLKIPSGDFKVLVNFQNSDDQKTLWTIQCSQEKDEDFIIIKCIRNRVYKMKIEQSAIPKPNSDAGCCSLSSDGLKLLLICTRSNGYPAKVRGNLGEQLVEFDESTHLVCVSLDSNSGLVVKNIHIPGSDCDLLRIPLSASWCRDDPNSGLIVTYMEMNKSLEICGLKFCYNRKTLMAKGSSPYELIPFQNCGENHDRSVRWNTQCVVWLRLPLPCAPHAQCMKLMCFYPSLSKSVCLVDQVESVVDEFGGIETDLPTECFLSVDSCNYVVFDGAFGFKSRICAVQILPEIDEHEIKFLDPVSKKGNIFRVLGARHNYILALKSRIDNSGELMIGIVKTIENVEWISVDCFPKKTFDFDVAIDFNKRFSGQYALIEAPNPVGVIVCAHGGPNGRFRGDFFGLGPIMSALAVKLHLDVLLLNYIGSTGYGTEGPNRLIGHIGTIDVNSCVDLIISAKEKFSEQRQWKRWFYSGGSHGGYLGLHLLANERLKQSGIEFRAAILRNPVCDAVQMLSTSDIKDYVYSQYLGVISSSNNYDHEGNEPVKVLKKLWEVSPMRVLDQINTPCLFLLGKNDKRVPMSNGTNCYSQLRTHGVPCELYVFDDNHALCKDCIVRLNGALLSMYWIQKYF
ncbi:hypothetical protein ACOME3_001918 [Neoechinorhynchus agilis]